MLNSFCVIFLSLLITNITNVSRIEPKKSLPKIDIASNVNNMKVINLSQFMYSNLIFIGSFSLIQFDLKFPFFIG